MSLKIGSLFSGYGGLDMAVESVLDAETAWFVEFDKAPSKILAHHWPDVPNYGDITKVKWAPDCPACGGSMAVYRRRVEGDPFNEFAGEPFYWCPACGREWDVSIRHDDPEAHLIPEPVDIITGGSPCQDLSHAGKRQGMTEGTRSNLWVAMREAIAHLRPGLVVWENVRGAYSAAADSEVEPCAGCVGDGTGVHLRALGRVLGDLSDLGYDCRWHGLRAADIGAPHGRFRVFVAAHARSSGAGWDRRAIPSSLGQIGRPNGDVPAAVNGGLLPTPRASDGEKGGPNQAGSSGDLMLPSAVQPDRWGQYADAIARWEALTRPAPAPTQPSKKGTPQLSPAFSEWLMGLPEGHVTDVPGLSRNDMLKALGNGVVPQQATAALRFLLNARTAA